MILIVDGMNLFIRNFCVVPTMDTNGNSIGGLTGFLKGLKNMVKDCSPDKVIVAWDGEGGSARRRGIFAEYKAGRKVRLNREDDLESQDDSFKNMGAQLTKLRTLLGLLGVVQIDSPGIEADDVIAFLCRFVFPDDKKVVLTSDRDMLQLIDANTVVYSPTKKIYWTRPEMLEKVGVLPENYIYVKAMMGDGSDNIPGLGGIGEKTAVKLFPFLAERPSNVEEIRSHSEANVGTNPRYKGVLDKWERFLENVKLMQLSHPIISSQSARTIRISATEQKPRFVFTEFKLQLIRDGIQVIDQDLVGVFQSYRMRAESAA